MNRKTKVKLAIAGLLLTANIVEGYVKAKEQQKKDKQIEALIAGLREGMVTNVTNITSEVKDEETSASTSITQGVIGIDEFGKDIQGITLRATDGVEINSYTEEELGELRNEIDTLRTDVCAISADDSDVVSDEQVLNILNQLNRSTLHKISETLDKYPGFSSQDFKDYVVNTAYIEKALSNYGDKKDAK